jgi:putative RNA 2'-phosphotransferase
MPNLTTNQLNISKSISYFLRHCPAEINIILDIDGWTELDQFLIKLSINLNQDIQLLNINEILQNSEKKRFEINTEKNLIRARYGHSVDIKLDYPLLIDDSIQLYHGTVKSNFDSIIKSGILPKSRKYVHLTSEKELAILTAKRWSDDVVLFELNVSKLIEDGVKIYDTGEKIYLIQQVDPKYIC